jgi:hypothetical protein
MSLGNPSICRRVYEKGETKCYDVSTRTGDITFSGKCPEYFALEHAEVILNCINCIKYGSLNGHQFAMCVNCGEDTGAQRGFSNFCQESDDETSFHRPSVFDTYLADKDDWGLTRIGDKMRENTIQNMVFELYNYLCEKFGYEEEPTIRGLCDYLFSLDHNPKEAFYRINEAMGIPHEQLYDRNWAYLFGPHFDSEDDYIVDDDEEDEININFEELCKAPEETRPVMMRTDTEYHYGSCNSEVGDSEVDYFMFLSDRRRGMSIDSNEEEDEDAVSEISVCEVESQQEQLQEQEQEQEQIVQVMEDA